MQCAVCSMQCYADAMRRSSVDPLQAQQHLQESEECPWTVEQRPTLWPLGVPAVSRVICGLPEVAMAETR